MALKLEGANIVKRWILYLIISLLFVSSITAGQFRAIAFYDDYGDHEMDSGIITLRCCYDR